eukprot:192067-Rhodomonas_salina.3
MYARGGMHDLRYHSSRSDIVGEGKDRTRRCHSIHPPHCHGWTLTLLSLSSSSHLHHQTFVPSEVGDRGHRLGGA